MDYDISIQFGSESKPIASAQAQFNAAGPSVGPTASLSRSRSLRNHVPLPVASTSVRPEKPTASQRESSRKSGCQEAFEKGLGPEAIAAKRKKRIQEKERELKKVVEDHDAAIREQFHLERFVTLVEGWDPEQAKFDNSSVFLEWKDSKHNLLNLLSHQIVPDSASPAGPSRPRTSISSRTTRRKAHEQSELLAHVVAPVVTSDGQISSNKINNRYNNASEKRAKGKGRAGEDASHDDGSTPAKSVLSRGKHRGLDVEMLSPPLLSKKDRAARRTTMGATLQDMEAEAVVEKEDLESFVTRKRRGRLSLPSLPVPKKLRSGKVSSEVVGIDPSAPPAVETSIAERPPSPSPLIVIGPQPSLSHLPFPPVPKRPRPRIMGIRKTRYTEPSQLPPFEPKFEGDISFFLNSYVHINDTGIQPGIKTLEAQAKKEGHILARVTHLQQHGRLQRLIDESGELNHTTTSNSQTKVVKLPPRQTDFQDSLMLHMAQVRNAVLNEAKAKPVACKRIAKMIQVYWERMEGKDERERLAEEKERKRLGKELMKALRKKWALAVKIVRAKLQEAQKLEQDRLGKVHLQNMLKRSTGLLEAQVQGAEDDDENENKNEDEEEDGYEYDTNSESTVYASAAEDPEAKGNDEEKPGISSSIYSESFSARPSSVPPGFVKRKEIGKDSVEEMMEDNEDNEEDKKDEENEEDKEQDNIKPFEQNQNLWFLVSEDADIAEDGNLDHQINGNDAPNTASTAVLQAMDTQHIPANDLSSQVTREVTGIIKDVTEKTEVPLTLGEPSLMPSPASQLLLVNTNSASRHPPETDPQASPVVSFSRSQHERKLSALATSVHPDPDANDVEFFASGESDLDERDAELDEEMEEADVGDGISEDEGLLADASLPIEVLLKKYGFSMPGSSENQDTLQEVEKVTIIEDFKSSMSYTEPASSSQPDQSLTDAALFKDDNINQIILNGKRQRKKRDLWSPDDAGPQALVDKRKKEKKDRHGGDIAFSVKQDEYQELQESEGEDEEDEEEDDDNDEEDEEETEDDDVEEEEGQKEAEDRIAGKNELDTQRVRQPFLLRGTLRPYQQSGLEWLASLWNNNMNGILADEMGLGKTIQTIALLAHLACEKGIWGQHLIIVPTSVILNWEMEFKKFLPGMKVLTYYGNQKERKEKRVGWHTENTWQVCVTSYQIVLADQHIFRRKSWCYMILDEAHNIKNFRSQRWQTLLGFKTQKRLLLTGTPLQNNLMELWSLLYFLMPGGIGADATAVVGFANHKEFMEWFSNPMDKAIENGDAIDEETLETVAKLHTLLRPFILRRLKSEVETQLPGKFEHVVYCRLSKRQRFLYDEFMARASTREALTSGGYLGVMNTLMQLRKVCNHPDLFEVRPVRTSFTMDNVLKSFEPQEFLVRKRLLEANDEKRIDLLALGLGVTLNEDLSGWAAVARQNLDATDSLPYAITPVQREEIFLPIKDTRTVRGWLNYRHWTSEEASKERWASIRAINRRRCSFSPVYGSSFLAMLGSLPNYLLPQDAPRQREEALTDLIPPAANLVLSFADRAKTIDPIIERFVVAPPNAVAREVSIYALPGFEPASYPLFTDIEFNTLHRSAVKLQIAFPEASLLQYDCGKLQRLWEMLRDLKAEGHRVLIFTQMTRVLDILEMFLSYNGHRYLRLDGSTKIEDRQVLTERFNSDPRIFVFIASSRSGGVGINLTGADTVFFYDSDWNPSMDRQCMDRAHRIGQTREVHIYRFVSSHTVEENMLRKAEQKRLLDKMVIQEGGFNNDWWGRVGWKDMFGNMPDLSNTDIPNNTREEGIFDIDVEDAPVAEDVEDTRPRLGQEKELARALAEVEDEEDVQAAKMAQGEGELDLQEFEEGPKGLPTKRTQIFEAEKSGTPMTSEVIDVDNEIEEEEVGGVEEYMLKLVEEDWEFFVSYRA
ncbi:hypothetical protein L204_106069 [Cryptococcus depauperatus]